MSWVTIIWSMISAACLTLAVVSLLVWLRKRAAMDNLFFALATIGTAVMAICELWMMKAATTAEFGLALRWLHVAAWLIVVGMIFFVRHHLLAGRWWLVWAACILRTISLALNFLTGPNLNFSEISHLRFYSFLGETVALGVGVSNPWMLVGQLSLLLFVAFVADATIAVWRRGDRQKALLIGGSIVTFVVLGTAQSILVLWQIVHWPYTPSLFFMGIVLAVTYELSQDVLRAEQLAGSLRESEERMTLAAEAAGFGIWMWTIQGNQIWGSARWRQLFGFAPDARVTFEAVMLRIHPEDRASVEREVRRVLADRSDYAGEFRVVLPEGPQHWITARGRVYFDPLGQPVRMMGAAVNITHRIQSEREISRQREELTHLSRVTMLGELAGSLAHELNQPLTAILSNAQAAQRFLTHPEPDLAELRDILTDIVSEDKRAGDVIHRLRLMLKKGVVQYQPLNLNLIVQEVLKLVRSDLVNRSISVQTVLASDLPDIDGDRVQLQQVLLNLVMNACDAMADLVQDDGRFIIRTSRNAVDEVCVAVVDFGTGIAPDRLDQVFEPFYTTKTHGMGLGLAVCRTIALGHGGRLWAENNPERGVTFTIALPVAGTRGDRRASLNPWSNAQLAGSNTKSPGVK